jgi:monoamine oxidase
VRTDVLIVGGGLSGLALADRLSLAGVNYLLVEARDRLGGRILAHTATGSDGQARFDLGPAWFWPGQPRIADILERLGLPVFDQYAHGDIMSEDNQGRVQRGKGFASMQGSHRVAGGFSTLIDGLRDRLDPKRLLMGRSITAISRGSRIVQAEISALTPATQQVTATIVVLAIPPRIAAETIDFGQDISASVLGAMRKVPTWMAGQAKIMALFDRPFWREAGLSGDAISRMGPMVEIHDASPAHGGPYGLFGFVGFPADVRVTHRDRMMELARDQLVRLFGHAAANPMQLVLQDWAAESLTATQSDVQVSALHPAYGLPSELANLWSGRLIFGSTEVARQFGGLLEGALEASEAALELINSQLATEAAPSVHISS